METNRDLNKASHKSNWRRKLEKESTYNSEKGEIKESDIAIRDKNLERLEIKVKEGKRGEKSH